MGKKITEQPAWRCANFDHIHNCCTEVASVIGWDTDCGETRTGGGVSTYIPDSCFRKKCECPECKQQEKEEVR